MKYSVTPFLFTFFVDLQNESWKSSNNFNFIFNRWQRIDRSKHRLKHQGNRDITWIFCWKDLLTKRIVSYKTHVFVNVIGSAGTGFAASYFLLSEKVSESRRKFILQIPKVVWSPRISCPELLETCRVTVAVDFSFKILCVFLDFSHVNDPALVSNLFDCIILFLLTFWCFLFLFNIMIVFPNLE